MIIVTDRDFIETPWGKKFIKEFKVDGGLRVIRIGPSNEKFFLQGYNPMGNLSDSQIKRMKREFQAAKRNNQDNISLSKNSLFPSVEGTIARFCSLLLANYEKEEVKKVAKFRYKGQPLYKLFPVLSKLNTGGSPRLDSLYDLQQTTDKKLAYAFFRRLLTDKDSPLRGKTTQAYKIVSSLNVDAPIVTDLTSNSSITFRGTDYSIEIEEFALAWFTGIDFLVPPKIKSKNNKFFKNYVQRLEIGLKPKRVFDSVQEITDDTIKSLVFSDILNTDPFQARQVNRWPKEKFSKALQDNPQYLALSVLKKDTPEYSKWLRKEKTEKDKTLLNFLDKRDVVSSFYDMYKKGTLNTLQNLDEEFKSHYLSLMVFKILGVQHFDILEDDTEVTVEGLIKNNVPIDNMLFDKTALQEDIQEAVKKLIQKVQFRSLHPKYEFEKSEIDDVLEYQTFGHDSELEILETYEIKNPRTPLGDYWYKIPNVFHGTSRVGGAMSLRFGLKDVGVKAGRSGGNGVYFAPNPDKSGQYFYLKTEGTSNKSDYGLLFRGSLYIKKPYFVDDFPFLQKSSMPIKKVWGSPPRTWRTDGYKTHELISDFKYVNIDFVIEKVYKCKPKLNLNSGSPTLGKTKFSYTPLPPAIRKNKKIQKKIENIAQRSDEVKPALIFGILNDPAVDPEDIVKDFIKFKPKVILDGLARYCQVNKNACLSIFSELISEFLLNQKDISVFAQNLKEFSSSYIFKISPIFSQKLIKNLRNMDLDEFTGFPSKLSVEIAKNLDITLDRGPVDRELRFNWLAVQYLFNNIETLEDIENSFNIAIKSMDISYSRIHSIIYPQEKIINKLSKIIKTSSPEKLKELYLYSLSNNYGLLKILDYFNNSPKLNRNEYIDALLNIDFNLKEIPVSLIKNVAVLSDEDVEFLLEKNSNLYWILRVGILDKLENLEKGLQLRDKVKNNAEAHIDISNRLLNKAVTEDETVAINILKDLRREYDNIDPENFTNLLLADLKFPKIKSADVAFNFLVTLDKARVVSRKARSSKNYIKTPEKSSSVILKVFKNFDKEEQLKFLLLLLFKDFDVLNVKDEISMCLQYFKGSTEKLLKSTAKTLYLNTKKKPVDLSPLSYLEPIIWKVENTDNLFQGPGILLYLLITMPDKLKPEYLERLLVFVEKEQLYISSFGSSFRGHIIMTELTSKALQTILKLNGKTIKLVDIAKAKKNFYSGFLKDIYDFHVNNDLHIDIPFMDIMEQYVKEETNIKQEICNLLQKTDYDDIVEEILTELRSNLSLRLEESEFSDIRETVKDCINRYSKAERDKILSLLKPDSSITNRKALDTDIPF